LRQDREVTQERLAELVGLSVRQMKRFEAGDSALNIDQLERIANALNVEPSELLAPPDRPIHRTPGRQRKSPKLR
jgi:transcriptional regulator with XRE-family HTH domain